MKSPTEASPRGGSHNLGFVTMKNSSGSKDTSGTAGGAAASQFAPSPKANANAMGESKESMNLAMESAEEEVVDRLAKAKSPGALAPTTSGASTEQTVFDPATRVDSATSSGGKSRAVSAATSLATAAEPVSLSSPQASYESTHGVIPGGPPVIDDNGLAVQTGSGSPIAKGKGGFADAADSWS